MIMDKALHGVACPRGRAQGTGADPAQERRSTSCRCPASWPTARSSDPEMTEILHRRGRSAPAAPPRAAGTADYQAILPLWGKMLNVEKARLDKVYGNDKLMPIVTALRQRASARNSILDKLRYGKVIIMADADVDGSHIRTLLLHFLLPLYAPADQTTGTFTLPSRRFTSWCKGKKRALRLYRRGARPPSAEELAAVMTAIQRYKGLGEMDAAPARGRRPWTPQAQDPDRAWSWMSSRAGDETFTVLMGDKVEPRRAVYRRVCRDGRQSRRATQRGSARAVQGRGLPEG